MGTTTYEKKRALITGGSGFIGAALVNSLYASGWDIISYDINAPLINIPTASHPWYIQGSILDHESLKIAMQGVDYVFHLAGISSVPDCTKHPQQAIEVNVLGTAAVLEAMRAVAPEAVVLLASSAHVYGGGTGNTHFSEADSVAPGSMYGSSKVAAEIVARQYRRSYGLDVRIARYSNVYGKGQTQNILYDFCVKAKTATTEFFIEGSGRQQRDFIHIDDAVAASIDMATGTLGDDGTLNISSGTPTSVSYLAMRICELMGRSDLHIRTTKHSWVGDVDILTCSNQALNDAFPRRFVEIADGTADYVTWFMQSPHTN
jgi:UDP-glucose 4-epimerase